MTNKLCTDCKHFTPNVEARNTEVYQHRYAICSRTSTVTLDSGEQCNNERSAAFFWINHCGKKARFFQQKDQS